MLYALAALDLIIFIMFGEKSELSSSSSLYNFLQPLVISSLEVQIFSQVPRTQTTSVHLNADLITKSAAEDFPYTEFSEL
jgi:hypothetical protein